MITQSNGINEVACEQPRLLSTSPGYGNKAYILTGVTRNIELNILHIGENSYGTSFSPSI